MEIASLPQHDSGTGGAVTRASQLAGLFSSLKNLGLTDRYLLSEIMRGVL